MKKIGITIIADEGKQLKNIKHNLIREVFDLGTNLVSTPNGTAKVNIEEKDIIEVHPINVNGYLYYVESYDRNSIITELIRQKYSLDQELALMANARLNPNSKEEQDFQHWRNLCKQAVPKNE